MSHEPLSIQRIAQLSVRVHHVETAVRFYQGTLGLNLLFSQPNMALFDCSGIRMLLSVPEQPQYDHPSSTIYFQVEDIEASYRKLEDQGITLMGKPHKIAEFGGVAIWMAFFYDPDRNLHALTSEVPL